MVTPYPDKPGTNWEAKDPDVIGRASHGAISIKASIWRCTVAAGQPLCAGLDLGGFLRFFAGTSLGETR
jgi:hypothetical protein